MSHTLTPFDEYPEDFKQRIKKEVLEVLEPWIDSKKVSILSTYMGRLPTSGDVYWWNREALFYVLSEQRNTFKNVISMSFPKQDFSASTVTETIKLGNILKHPELGMLEVMEE